MLGMTIDIGSVFTDLGLLLAAFVAGSQGLCYGRYGRRVRSSTGRCRRWGSGTREQRPHAHTLVSVMDYEEASRLLLLGIRYHDSDGVHRGMKPGITIL